MRDMSNLLRKSGLGLALVLSLVTASAVSAETPAEQANKKLVLDFYAALNQADATHSTKERIQGIAEQFLAPDYRQHSEMFQKLPGPGTARDKLIRMFQSMPPMSQADMGTPATVAIMAEGDLVMMLTSRVRADPSTSEIKTAYIFNMFRVRGGKLVEHWDVAASPMGGPPPGGPPAGAPPSRPPGP